jgi:hypothetical protein
VVAKIVIDVPGGGVGGGGWVGGGGGGGRVGGWVRGSKHNTNPFSIEISSHLPHTPPHTLLKYLAIRCTRRHTRC